MIFTDDIYFGLLTKLPFSTGNLKDVTKIFFCHTEICVELGFSISEQILQRNLKEQSLVSENNI